MEAGDHNGLIQGFPARFIRLSEMRCPGGGAAARPSPGTRRILEKADLYIPAARRQAANWYHHMRAVVLAALWAGATLAAPVCGAQRYLEPSAFAGAYVFTEPYGRGGTVEYLYDHGKYAIRKPNEVRLYDGANPAVRWWLDPRSRIAKIDYTAVQQRLYREIVAHGVDSVSRSTGLDRASLLRFQTDFPRSVVRNLDHLLYIPSTREMADYNRTGAGTVCGIRCIVYTLKNSPDHQMWVEPSTGFVFQWQYKEVSANPRIAPQVRHWQITSFRRAAALDPSRFILPPGTTAELPRILADMPLPPGVKRKILTGKYAELGHPL